MFSAVTWLLVAGVLGATGGHDGAGSFLYQPAYAADEVLRAPAEPYLPQPGDLVFCTDHKVFWCMTHSWAGAGHPHHSFLLRVGGGIARCRRLARRHHGSPCRHVSKRPVFRPLEEPAFERAPQPILRLVSAGAVDELPGSLGIWGEVALPKAGESG